MLKNYFLLFLSLSLIFPTFSFVGGDGNPGSPYLISTCTELQNMSSDLSANYELNNSFDCSGIPNFKPIGYCTGFCNLGGDDFQFNGTLNGNFNTISNINIINLTSDSHGLFGYARVAEIKNINLSNINISANNSVGGLVGYGHTVLINNTFIYGSVSGSGLVGGFIGTDQYSDTYNSKFFGEVTGLGDSIGGIYGYTYWVSIISNTSFSGEVSGNDDVGGIVGEIYNGQIINSYSEGSVLGNDKVGGLVGFFDGGSDITNSHSTMDITGSGSVGGLIGDSYGGATVENSYSSGNILGINFVGGIIGYGYSSFTKIIINNIYNLGSINGNDFVGGLLGYIYNADIENGYNTGSVSGNNSVGGLIGYQTHDSTLQNSFSTGDVTGINSSTTGGLVGQNIVGSGSDSNITNSYWLNTSGNPSTAFGFDDNAQSASAQTDISYFYNYSNQPFNGNWNNSGIWNFTGSNLPFFVWDELEVPTSSNSISSLFPFTGIYVPLILVMGYLLFN
jgi:hypothetical protein